MYHKWLLNWIVGPLWLVATVTIGPAIIDRIRRRTAIGCRRMSWAAHQFEIYAVQAHLPKKMKGKVSFFGIFLGDFTPDFLSKFWVYGITINGHHYGSTVPHKWHRGWPGMGITHTLFLGAIFTAIIWTWRRNRAFTIGYLLGFAAHALTDVNDSVGTMLLFPFTTLSWTLETWAYAATISGGKYLDAASYYSSLGLVMDLFWLVVVLCSWRIFTREYWRTNIVPADAHVWAALGRWLPERSLLALVPRDVLLRRVPPRRLVDVGACRRASSDQRRTAPRLSARSVVERAVVARGAFVAPCQPVARPARGVAVAGPRLLGGQPPVGAHGPGPRSGACPTLVFETLVAARRDPLVGGRHCRRAQRIGRVELERAQERDGARVAGDGERLGDQADRRERPVHRSLQRGGDERGVGDRELSVAHALRAHGPTVASGRCPGTDRARGNV